jgi:hypothetical protein
MRPAGFQNSADGAELRFCAGQGREWDDLGLAGVAARLDVAAAVVVRAVPSQDGPQVPFTKDQDAVGELGADGQNEAFGEAVQPQQDHIQVILLPYNLRRVTTRRAADHAKCARASKFPQSC